MTRTLLASVALVALVALTALGCEKSAKHLSDKGKKSMQMWRADTESANGYSKHCSEALKKSFEPCFLANYSDLEDKLDIRFADCVNKRASAECISAGKMPDGKFRLDRSPIAPP